MTTQTTPGEIEFVNDWEPLSEAFTELQRLVTLDYLDISRGYEGDDDVWAYLEYIATYGPRLLTQYARLLELSLTLTEGWEQYAELNPPSGLFVPDHR